MNNSLTIMFRLLKLVKPLVHIMIATIIMGVCGYLSAIFITTLGALALISLLGFETFISFKSIIIFLVIFALLRAIFRYLEHLSGHFIAFKLLALLRDKVFNSLRKIAFEKLNNKDSGQLLSIITTDIELLEVFYAHTIAPVAIAFITSVILVIMFLWLSPYFALIALLGYVTIGIILPIITTGQGRAIGREYRDVVSQMNDHFFDSIKGAKELRMFIAEKSRLDDMIAKSHTIDTAFSQIKKHEAQVRMYSEMAIAIFNAIIVIVGLVLCSQSLITISSLVIGVVLMLSSYGSVLALANLSSNLVQVLASGDRVLALLEEQSKIKEVTNGYKFNDISHITVNDLSFGYNDELILKNMSFEAYKGEIIGIYGKSGCGKSTFLKLLMRFYDPNNGTINFNNHNLQEINTQSLRNNIAFIAQQTYLFNETIYENIVMANRKADYEAVIKAAKKASIDDFIKKLANGYDTKIQELGSNVSDGEKQRIGLARAFLHNAPIILLDEPTSNLDSLNEAIILDSLLKAKKDKIIIIVSHRKSTMAICDKVIDLSSNRVS